MDFLEKLKQIKKENPTWTVLELRQNLPSLYNFAVKRKLSGKVAEIFGYKRKKTYTKEELISFCKKYKTLSEIKNGNNKILIAVYKRKLHQEALGHLKKQRRKLTKEICYQAFLKCKSRVAFQRTFPSEYQLSWKKGWLKEFFKDMPWNKDSTGQKITKVVFEKLLDRKCEYNDRKALNRKELDIYFPDLKLAIEYNGVRWHQLAEVKVRDAEKVEECKNKGIFLVTIEEPEKRHGSLQSFSKEIKKKIIKKIEEINRHTGLKITPRKVALVSVSQEDL